MAGNCCSRREQKRADYLLRYGKDYPIAVIEAKAEHKLPGDGLQQAKDYAQLLDLKFAYSTNGKGIVEFDFLKGTERELTDFPTPDELWTRLRKSDDIRKLSEDSLQRLLTPADRASGKTLRYYQENAVNRALQAILQGKKRILLTMATGTGKTEVAFQICWKLWSSRWNRKGEPRKPKILYLSDRNFLVDDPKDKTFLPFGDARHKITNGQIIKSREMYFAIYQAIAKDVYRPGLYREYAQDFFDFIIVDECHRGSANDESNWREILEYFKPAVQLGMTATPLREDNKDTYAYFGNPIYTYSLRQGIEDGFLAPYRVHRVVTTVDAAGWRPCKGDLDRYGREIPDEEYHTKDFERVIALRARTKAIAKHLTHFLKENDRFAKTIVFCVDQEHAAEMSRAIVNLNSDLVSQDKDYVCRIVADEGDVGKAKLSSFQDPENNSPVIVTTSQLLSTGVDIPTCKIIALARVVGSMTEFKQIIGRGTRVRDEYNKFYFTILDYTGSATRHFADPEFDGEPDLIVEEEFVDSEELAEEVHPEPEFRDENIITTDMGPVLSDDFGAEPRKLYFDGGSVEIVAQIVSELDSDGKQLRVVQYADYTAEKVRTLYPELSTLRDLWADPLQREVVIQALSEKGIDFKKLASTANQPDADPFDLLCYLAYGAPLRTRRERAEMMRRERKDFFEQFGTEARKILELLLDKYANYGVDELRIPETLKQPPLSDFGNPNEISDLFGGIRPFVDAVMQLQNYLYAS